MSAWSLIAAVVAVTAVDSLAVSLIYPNNMVLTFIGYAGAAGLAILVGSIVTRLERLEHTVGLRPQTRQKHDVNDGAF